MGLDHYLYKKTYVRNWSHMQPEELHTITIKKGGKKRKDIKPERISYIVETVAQWRKFNALHKWFVLHVQNGEDDCKEHYVPIEDLNELLTTLKEVIKLKNTGNEDKLNDLFPTASGFFFGGTAYDEWYFNDVQETIELLEGLIKEGGDFYYDSSW